MGIKKSAVNVLAYKYVRRGFEPKYARFWVRLINRHKRGDYDFTKQETRDALSVGFMPEQLKAMGITAEESKEYVSFYDYMFLKPMNAGYSKWLIDKYTRYNIFKPFCKNMQEIYYLITNTLDNLKIIPSGSEASGTGMDDVIAFIRKKGIVSLETASDKAVSDLSYAEECFYLDEQKFTEEEIRTVLASFGNNMVICEKLWPSDIVDNGLLNLIVFNDEGDNPRIGDAYFTFDALKKTSVTALRKYKLADVDDLNADDWDEEKFNLIRDSLPVDEKNGLYKGQKIPYWEDIKNTVMKLCSYAPELEFFGMEILINEDGFRIVRITGNPDYPSCKPFSKETSEYLKKKVAEKKKYFAQPGVGKKNGIEKIRRRIRKSFARTFYPKSLMPYLSIKWPARVWDDFRHNKEASFREKMWAYKRGFLSYRIKQYGITEENRSEFISDFEYLWLRNINNSYRMWLTDKISLKYLCRENSECFPAYYFHIIPKNGANKVISMMDLPEGYTNSYDDIFRLVEEIGVLALKRDSGSHGEGFYKFEYVDGKYKLNYNEVTKEDVLEILTDPENKYLITEYINMCDELKAVYDGAVNTVRMLVFKRDGHEPVIGNAYLRIGSKKTGAVDNVGAGGMTAHIDVETGHFYDARVLTDYSIQPCQVHPDTGAPIDGYLPNWEKVKKQVLDVTRSLEPIDWFGVDAAVTNDGIKFPEINRFPDFPGVEPYSKATREYLMHRLEIKKHYYGYDKKPNKTLIHLPKR